MPDLRIDEEQVAAAAQALRALGAETLTAAPDTAARLTGHPGLIDAAAWVQAQHMRAARAISAEALSLADAMEHAVDEVLGVDRDLALGAARGGSSNNEGRS